MRLAEPWLRRPCTGKSSGFATEDVNILVKVRLTSRCRHGFRAMPN
jgi:hypothetical protein